MWSVADKILSDTLFHEPKIATLDPNEDPLSSQIWKVYSQAKDSLPNGSRMENLSWRLMAKTLRLKEGKPTETSKSVQVLEEPMMQQQQDDLYTHSSNSIHIPTDFDYYNPSQYPEFGSYTSVDSYLGDGFSLPTTPQNSMSFEDMMLGLYMDPPSDQYTHSSMDLFQEEERPQQRCSNCDTTTTPLWRRDPYQNPLCNACGLFYKLHGVQRPLCLKTNVIKKRNRSRADTSSSSSSSSSNGSSSKPKKQRREIQQTPQSPAPSQNVYSLLEDIGIKLHTLPPELLPLIESAANYQASQN
ncbi:hypothetical protein K501DRAFT_284564 [Backusella circina FSU 941]|nr:hypothetical protein K501DRAFT_284564 [Backusella circina FSU 941]